MIDKCTPTSIPRFVVRRLSSEACLRIHATGSAVLSINTHPAMNGPLPPSTDIDDVSRLGNLYLKR